MPTASYTRQAAYPVGPAKYTTYSFRHSWDRSPRVNGKLVKRANPWSLTVVSASCTNWHAGGPAPIVYPSFQATTNDPMIQRAKAIAESDLRGKLARRIKDGNSGSLGVSIASSAQSIAMMRESAEKLVSIFAATERFYQTTRGKRRLKRLRRLINRGAKPTAGMVLEGFFGWAPLLGDITSAAKTLADPWPPKSWFSVKSKPWLVSKPLAATVDPTGHYVTLSEWSATGHSTYSCACTVSNPNLWVANKLGLLNVTSIAWDLVPWSFLVNMVSNLGQVMGSLTDFTGLALSDTSMTTSLHQTEASTVSYSDPRPKAEASAEGKRVTKVRGRTVGVAPPSVTPYLRFPSWGVGAAAITGSLLIQHCERLDNLLRIAR